MRLLGLIIAVLLAVTAGILVVSTPHAAASGERPPLATTVLGHDHAAHSNEGTVSAESASAHNHTSTRNDCGDPTSGDHGSGGTDCCNMGACHAVQALVAPVLHMPLASASVLAVVRDQQVEGVILGGLDKPPRTV